jgi:predicted nucleic acid-binding Zn ribbon protein
VTDQPSGADLARQMLRRAQADARNRPTTGTQKPKRGNRPRGDGRDPIGLGAVLGQLQTDMDWKTSVAGGTVLDRWATIAPELVGKVAAEAFDPASRTLALRPSSSAYATQLRWLGQQMVTRINQAMGGDTVRAVRILSPRALPGAATAPEPDKPRLVAAAEQAPRTRADAPPGFHRALDALEAARADTDTDGPDAAARDRWFGDIRGTLREPEPAAQPTALHRPSSTADDARARALAYKRAETTGQPVPGVRRLGETA